MTYYTLREEPGGPLRGGSFNLDEIGSEANNFHVIAGRLYGYAQASRGGGFNLARLGAPAADRTVDGVLVAMFATADAGGQYLVGWYRDATCHAESYARPRGTYGDFNFEAEASSAVLLPLSKRTLEPPSRLEGGFGQANVRYAHSSSGELALQPWMAKTIEWIRRYSGPNMLDGADPGYHPVRASSHGQGPRLNTAQRRAVEARSMKVARTFFSARGYEVEDVHSRSSYDLVCTKGKDVFRVEVKGTTGGPIAVLVTRNEVLEARDLSARTVLFVVSNIELRGAGSDVTGHGGVAHWIRNWRPRDEHLEVTAYRYHLPRDLRPAR